MAQMQPPLYSDKQLWVQPHRDPPKNSIISLRFKLDSSRDLGPQVSKGPINAALLARLSLVF